MRLLPHWMKLLVLSILLFFNIIIIDYFIIMAIQYKQVNKKGKHASPMCCSTDPRLLDSTFVMPRGGLFLVFLKIELQKVLS